MFSSEDWRRQALQTRQMFESNATLKDPQEIARKIKETQKWIKEHWHPDPYNSKGDTRQHARGQDGRLSLCIGV